LPINQSEPTLNSKTDGVGSMHDTDRKCKRILAGKPVWKRAFD
jgi:hypothetical protein